MSRYPKHLAALFPALAAFLLIQPAQAQGFGTTAAIGSGEVFLSDPNNNYAPGRVFVYRLDGNAWRVAGQLTADRPSPLDRFGRSLSFSGGRLLVGATSIDSSNGAAFIFERGSDGQWRQTTRLVPDEVVAGDAWGRQVLLDQGNRAIVASWGADSLKGAVAIWVRDQAGQWNHEATLTASNASANDRLGSSIAVSGDRIVLGAAGRDTSRGIAYVFHRDAATGQWSEEAKLEVAGLPRGASLGSALAMKGDEVLVGAPGVERGIGVVYRFERDPDSGSWSEVGRLYPMDAAPFMRFGSSITFAGNEVWVGAPNADRSGRVYRYHRGANGEWTSGTKLGFEGADPGDGFGGGITVGGDVAVLGLTGDDYGMGSAVIYRQAESSWTAGERLIPESVGLAAITGPQKDCAEGKIEIFSCGGVDLLSFLPISDIGGARGVRLNDVWGWTDPESNREYALIGRIDGTAFVDVSDPATPRFLGSLPRTAGSPASSWRDIKVYKNYAFIVSDGAQAHGMQVFDLTKLRSARGAPVTFTEDAHYDKIHSAHNIVIDTTSGFAFAVGASSGGETCGGALHMIDIRNPTAPAFAGCFADPATGRRRTGYTHDAQCVNYNGPDRDYRGREICFNASETAIGIADVTDKANPKAIANAAYPNVGYTHQGWLTEDQKYFYVNDELDEISGLVQGTRTLIWDLTDLDDPVLLKEYLSTNASSDHNLYIHDNVMYQSNYASGLRIYDVSNPESPVPVGFFDTVPVGADSPGFTGSWSNYPYFKSGTIVVTSIQEGLFLLKQGARPLVP